MRVTVRDLGIKIRQFLNEVRGEKTLKKEVGMLETGRVGDFQNRLKLWKACEWQD